VNIGNLIDVPITGGWQSWQSFFITDIQINAGSHKFTSMFFFGGFNVNYFDFVLTSTDVEEETELPDEFALHQNYPNPFNPETKINYELPKEGMVTLTIYNLLGKEIKTLINERKTVGKYNIRFNAGDLVSGIYFYKLQVNSVNGRFTSTKKMTFLK
jgi:hypothetical protein